MLKLEELNVVSDSSLAESSGDCPTCWHVEGEEWTRRARSSVIGALHSPALIQPLVASGTRRWDRQGMLIASLEKDGQGAP